jgi:hypothetical protein
MGTQVYKAQDGVRIPSVTTVLSGLGWKTDGLMFWAHGIGIQGIPLHEARSKAADAGTLAHAMAAADITGAQAPDLSDADADTRERAQAGFDAYRQWRRMSRLELVASEVPLVSEMHRFGGTLDAIAVFDGAAGILDFKSAKQLYGDHVIQVAAYRALWEENNPTLPLTHAHVFRWGPDGGFAHHSLSMPQVRAGWDAFLHLRALYDLKKKVCP